MKTISILLLAIFGVIYIVLNDKPHLSWFTFLSFLILAIVILIYHFKEFQLALTASLFLLVGLVEIYLWLWESFEMVQDVPMRIIGMVILAVVLVFFIFAFFAEKLLDRILGLISWSPVVAALAIICLIQTLTANLTPTETHMPQSTKTRCSALPIRTGDTTRPSPLHHPS